MFLQDIISVLSDFWKKEGCVVLPSYSLEMGAGTLHPATALNAVSNHDCSVAYLQPSIRPSDGRYGKDPYRLRKHHQFQVFIKPLPKTLRESYLSSLTTIGLKPKEEDIAFICDNWENPSIGASGVGWEVRYNGTEVTQITYMRQMGGISCPVIGGEVSYGLERLGLILQNVENVNSLMWNSKYSFGELFAREEEDLTKAERDFGDYQEQKNRFNVALNRGKELIEKKLSIAAYEKCLEASAALNLIWASGIMSVADRAESILRIRSLTKECCKLYIETDKNNDTSL